MLKNDIKQSLENKCPTCRFTGNEQFPKGYALEKHPKIFTVRKSGQEIQKFVTDKKTKEIIFDEIRRCPICGYVEGDKL